MTAARSEVGFKAEQVTAVGVIPLRAVFLPGQSFPSPHKKPSAVPKEVYILPELCGGAFIQKQIWLIHFSGA